ncbi:DUF1415 domain-containing protein [Legionella hackeliae]|nr:DUF1415 domain-containing protein [Legionella hackeliae]KTD14213.1 hypothetical protein Lhac_0525 [Legionella hackeliae]
MLTKTELIIENTKKWLNSFVIELNLCPFARKEVKRKSLRFVVSNALTSESALNDCISEIQLLDQNPAVETTLLIFSSFLDDFFDYLDFVDLCENTMHIKGYEGIYQVASFHPHYSFANEGVNDVSNYTNRSPYPMVHLLREKSLDEAIKRYGDTKDIPQKNIETLRKLGLENVKEILKQCSL